MTLAPNKNGYESISEELTSLLFVINANFDKQQLLP